jgi:hypothetical protein
MPLTDNPAPPPDHDPMDDARRCPNCRAANDAAAYFCVNCDALLATGEDRPDWPKQDLATPRPDVAACPRCLTRNPVNQVYCWRCLHELRSADVLDEALLPPIVPRVPTIAAMPLTSNATDASSDPPTPLPTEPAVAEPQPPVPSAHSDLPYAAAVEPTTSIQAASDGGGRGVRRSFGLAAAALGALGAILLVSVLISPDDGAPITAELPPTEPPAITTAAPEPSTVPVQARIDPDLLDAADETPTPEPTPEPTSEPTSEPTPETTSETSPENKSTTPPSGTSPPSS